jgi:hypothetical protein
MTFSKKQKIQFLPMPLITHLFEVTADLAPASEVAGQEDIPYHFK